MTLVRQTYTIFLLLALSSLGFGQAFNMNLDQTPTNWQPCSYLNQCNPGGSGTPASVLIQKSGSQLEVSVTGGPNTNFLASYKVGTSPATYFYADTWITPLPTAYAGHYEFDIGISLAPYEYMFGTQCGVGGVWDVFNQLTNQWVHTTIACNLSQGTPHYYQLWAHYLPGDTSCSGYPRQYFDEIGIDYVYTSLAGYVECAGPIPTGWGNNNWFQVQLDINGAAPANTTMTALYQYTSFVELATPVINPPSGLASRVN